MLSDNLIDWGWGESSLMILKQRSSELSWLGIPGEEMQNDHARL
jgi:hypothetical protein